VLLSGDHQAIRAWRRAQAQAVTQARRPDLWAAYLAGKTDPGNKTR
ncbi:MAG: tRNA (guanosine(37)-N1)-methyltransferase TrmD, partial [Alphaproteobacteria bacterium]